MERLQHLLSGTTDWRAHDFNDLRTRFRQMAIIAALTKSSRSSLVSATERNVASAMGVTLEIQPQTKLNLTRCARADRRRSERVGDDSKGGTLRRIGPLHVRLADLRMVEYVEHVCPEADAHPFRQSEPLVERQVDLPEARDSYGVSRGIAPLAVGRHGESVRIEPQVDALVVGIQGLAGNNIGTLIGVETIRQGRCAPAQSDVRRQAGTRDANTAQLPAAQK